MYFSSNTTKTIAAYVGEDFLFTLKEEETSLSWKLFFFSAEKLWFESCITNKITSKIDDSRSTLYYIIFTIVSEAPRGVIDNPQMTPKFYTISFIHDCLVSSNFVSKNLCQFFI